MSFDVAQAAFSQLLLSGTLVHEASFAEMQQRLGIQINPQLVMVASIDRYPDLAMGAVVLRLNNLAVGVDNRATNIKVGVAEKGGPLLYFYSFPTPRKSHIELDIEALADHIESWL